MRFVNLSPSPKLVCNVQACPTCKCANKACACDSLWTGQACEFNRLDYCCWPPPDRSKPVPTPYCAATKGVCGFGANQEKGLQACNVPQGPAGLRTPVCTECPPDTMVGGLSQTKVALGGPRCNVSACVNDRGTRGCVPGQGWCQSVCVDKQNLSHWVKQVKPM